MTKRFPSRSMRELARASLPTQRPPASGTTALADVTFEVAPGEVVGVVGPNGAGKSTLLKVAADILRPTAGTVACRGIPSAMIELGFSFHRDLTGRENLPLAAALAGVLGEEFDRLVDDVVAFSGIEEFLDRPVKHLSTGMAARLGFAMAIHVPAEVLLIDEVLAVGDRSFQQQCVQRVRTLADEGAAVLFVSHALDLVGQTCTRAICIDRGRVVDDGPVSEVLARYERSALAPPAASRQAARIVDVLLDRDTIASGEHLGVTCVVDVVDPAVPLQIRSELTEPGLPGAVNRDALPAGALDEAGHWSLSCEMGPLVLTAGRLEVGVSLVGGPDGATLHDRSSKTFAITGEQVGVMRFAVDGSWRWGPADDVEPQVVRPPIVSDAVVSCRGLTKAFRPPPLGRHRREPHRQEGAFVALDGVDLDVQRGGSLGIIGANGAGKSTLLRILAGVSPASAGTTAVDGSLAAVLELTAGFQPELSGAENLAFAWRVQGGRAADWDAALPAIETFAAIGASLDVPVKHYSSGMNARLAIALSLELDPDVLLLDEALSVGDIDFRERVRRRLLALVEGGTTLICASHDLHLIRSLCDRVIRLDRGRVVADGAAAEVIAESGGIGWSGGSSTADGSILLHEVHVRPELIPSWSPFDVAFDLEVVRPSPHTYLEFSIRDTLPADERDRPRTQEEILIRTLCLQQVPGLEEVVATPGRWRIEGTIAGLPLMNPLDIVISVIDEFEGVVLSEQWRTVLFGSLATANAGVDLLWTARRTGEGPGDGET